MIGPTLRLATGPTPVTSYWMKTPITATIARRPLAISEPQGR